MIRKVVGVAAAVLMSTAALTAIDSGVSGASGPPASGNVSCPVTGTGRFSPKLTLAGIAITAVKFTFKEASPTSGGCTGTVMAPNSAGTLGPVIIHGVTIKGVGYLQPLGPGNANACSVFSSSDTIGSLTVKYVWSATPAIAPSFVTYTTGSAPIVTGGLTDTINLQAALAATTGTGSFAPPATAPNTMLTNIAGACGSGWGPYPTFTIGVGSSIALP